MLRSIHVGRLLASVDRMFEEAESDRSEFPTIRQAAAKMRRAKAGRRGPGSRYTERELAEIAALYVRIVADKQCRNPNYRLAEALGLQGADGHPSADSARDLVSRLRHKHELITGAGQGRRGAALTSKAESLLAGVEK